MRLRYLFLSLVCGGGIVSALPTSASIPVASVPADAGIAAPRLSTAEIRGIEAFLRGTSLGVGNARLSNVRQVKILELSTRTAPLNGYCGEVGSGLNAPPRRFFAWRAGPGAPPHVLMQDNRRQRPIYDQYCRGNAGIPVIFGDAIDGPGQAGMPANWPATTWILFLGALALGAAFAFPLTALIGGFDPLNSARTAKRPVARPPMHLRVEDFD